MGCTERSFWRNAPISWRWNERPIRRRILYYISQALSLYPEWNIERLFLANMCERPFVSHFEGRTLFGGGDSRVSSTKKSTHLIKEERLDQRSCFAQLWQLQPLQHLLLGLQQPLLYLLGHRREVPRMLYWLHVGPPEHNEFTHKQNDNGYYKKTKGITNKSYHKHRKWYKEIKTWDAYVYFKRICTSKQKDTLRSSDFRSSDVDKLTNPNIFPNFLFSSWFFPFNFLDCHSTINKSI